MGSVLDRQHDLSLAILLCNVAPEFELSRVGLMVAEKTSRETKKLQLSKGHYAVRLLAKKGADVKAKIKVKAKDEGQGFDVLGEKTRGGVLLWDDEPLALVRVHAENALLEMEIDRGKASTRAHVGLDVQLLSLEKPSTAQDTSEYLQHSLVHLSGHVEMIGDTQKKRGEWLGKRSGTARIEGFTIQWDDKPDDVELVYGCTVEGLGKAPNSVTGGFVGTRQRAAAIKALWIDLKGEAKDRYQLNYVAAFSRSGALVGRPGKITSGLGVKDHLVGLAVAVVKKEA